MPPEAFLKKDPEKGEEMTSQALKTSKKQLRSLMKGKLSEISISSIEAQSTFVFESLIKFPQYIRAKRISIYLSMPNGEIQTEKLVHHALSNGKSVFVPYLHPNRSAQRDVPKRVMDMVKLEGVEDFKSLQRDSWGIPTIGSEGIEKRESILDGNQSDSGGKECGLDLMLLPGVAFEQNHDKDLGLIKRLGHGKGFYDFFLHCYRLMYAANEGNELQLFGLALQEQVVQGGGEGSLPMGPRDHFLHGLVVGNGQIIWSTSRK